MLSPGSFSEASVALVDTSGVPWLFVRTTEETEDSVAFINAVFEKIRIASATGSAR